MRKKNIVIYKKEEFELLMWEGNTVFHPSEMGVTPVWPKSSDFEYYSIFSVDNFQLTLQSFGVNSDGYCSDVCGVAPRYGESMEDKDFKEYSGLDYPLHYTGAIIIADDFLGDYGNEKDYPCYCYKNVIELIFNDGTLITTIDHKKAMVKIRKNIDKGLRDIHIRKDYRCIRRFMKDSLVGNYFQMPLQRKFKKAEGKFDIFHRG